MKRPPSEKPPHNDPHAAPPPWSARRRGVVSALLLAHLSAVVVGPWSLEPSSELSRNVAEFYSPYINACFLNHGYRFFAPQPEGGRTVRYELVMPDGTTREGRFPDRSAHRPRLLYHRFFMMSEQVVAGADLPREIIPPPPLPPWFLFSSEQSEREYKRMRRDHEQYLARYAPALTSISRFLKNESGADRVRLYLQVRNIPAPDEVKRGLAPSDDQLVTERELGELDADGSWKWTEEISGTGSPILP